MPTYLRLSEKLPSLYPATSAYGNTQEQQVDFANVKINVTWSKTLSVTNLMIADLRAVNQSEPHSKIVQALDKLSKGWDQREGKHYFRVLTDFCYCLVMPPYVEFISNLFSANIMRKSQNTDKSKTPATKTGGGAKSARGNQTNLMSTVRSGVSGMPQNSGRKTPYRR